MTRAERSADDPVSRLTRLADVAAEAVEASPEASGAERGIVLLTDDGEGGSCMFGFEDDDDAIEFLLLHVQAICRASGHAFHVIEADAN